MSEVRGMSARVGALAVLGGLVVAGLVADAASDDSPPARGVVVEAGVAMPAARPEPTLSSTWYCAAGSIAPNGFADHVVIIANPTDRQRIATVTALTGDIAPAPTPVTPPSSTTTKRATTTSTSTTTTVTPRPAKPPSTQIPVPSRSRVSYRLAELAGAPLVGAVVEVDGGEVSVEHELTGSLGRATAPCSTTASSTWSVPWGVTSRGDRELLVMMNPFPDDATVDVQFATDDGIREPQRFKGFVVPGRSVVGAFVDEDVTRKEQVSAQLSVRNGRIILDRVQLFTGVDGREGMALGLGAPRPALTWMFPDGLTGPGLAEQVVVYNPGSRVAEIELEVRLDDPSKNGTPEPFELTVAPQRYAIVNLDKEDRIVPGVGHSSFLRSLNGVPVVAERAVAATDGAARSGVGVTLGAPLAARTWYFPGGGTSADRDEFITILNPTDHKVTFDVTGLASGQDLAVQDLQDVELAAGARISIRLGDHVQRQDLPLVVTADGPIVAERGLYRVGGDGLSQAMGIPLGTDTFVPDPLNG